MKRILVAFDGGEPATHALHNAIDLAKKFGGEIGVVSVIPFHPSRFPVDPWDDRDVHTRELADARDILREEGMTAEFIEPYGDPARTIERIVEEGGYDTVIVGSRGLGPISRFFRGSVSEHVATHTEATVVIAR
ncbi:MAG TPA: universal stress protein [Candidatus Limnocylindrales bacterium]|nr:universal stress protein [Candidatus Limnocylindrales bacterium]